MCVYLKGLKNCKTWSCLFSICIKTSSSKELCSIWLLLFFALNLILTVKVLPNSFQWHFSVELREHVFFFFLQSASLLYTGKYTSSEGKNHRSSGKWCFTFKYKNRIHTIQKEKNDQKRTPSRTRRERDNHTHKQRLGDSKEKNLFFVHKSTHAVRRKKKNGISTCMKTLFLTLFDRNENCLFLFDVTGLYTHSNEQIDPKWTSLMFKIMLFIWTCLPAKLGEPLMRGDNDS